MQVDYDEPATGIKDLVSKSDLVLVGRIADVKARSRGVAFPAAGPDDKAILSEDVILVIQPSGSGNDSGERVEVRIEHVYDGSPGGESFDPSAYKFDQREYIFALRLDAEDPTPGAPATGFRCTEVGANCGFVFEGTTLMTTPRGSVPAQAVEEIFVDAAGISDVDDLAAVAALSNITIEGAKE